jgi:hypothetical protein
MGILMTTPPPEQCRQSCPRFQSDPKRLPGDDHGGRRQTNLKRQMLLWCALGAAQDFYIACGKHIQSWCQASSMEENAALYHD